MTDSNDASGVIGPVERDRGDIPQIHECVTAESEAIRRLRENIATKTTKLQALELEPDSIEYFSLSAYLLRANAAIKYFLECPDHWRKTYSSKTDDQILQLFIRHAGLMAVLHTAA